MLSGNCYRAIVAALLAASLTACASSGGYGNREKSAYGTSSAVDSEKVSKTVTVNITNFAFAPAAISISAGDTIVFVNQDGAPHTATADSGAFDTGTLASGQSNSITISDAGEYGYFCSIHPTMKGSIIVQ